jgi:hypothetical protein
VASLVVAAIGVLRAIAASRAFQQKAGAFAELPVLRAIAATSARLEASRARLDEAASLVDRVSAALESIRGSYTGARSTFVASAEPYRRAGADLNQIGALVFGLWSNVGRSPES